MGMKRVRLVSITTVAMVLLGAAPAWAIYTKIVGVSLDHISPRQNAPDGYSTAGGSRPKTKASGKVVLDSEKNPAGLPAEKTQCYKNRLVLIKKKMPGIDKEVGHDRTNDRGKFSDKFSHTHGTFYFYMGPKNTTNPEWDCFEYRSQDYTHEGPH